MQAIGKTKGGWNTKLHVFAADDKHPVLFSLTSGEVHDSVECRNLLCEHGLVAKWGTPLLMDRAYECDELRFLAMILGYNPVVPPKSNRKDPWEYDKELYKSRNEVERFFRRYDRFRRIFTRYDKLDFMFSFFFLIAVIFDCLN